MPRRRRGTGVILGLYATGLSAVMLVTLPADASDSAPTPQSKVYVVDRRGSDAHGDGTRLNPWRTLARACASVRGDRGHTIRVNPGIYTASSSCRLPCKTNLRGSGRTRTTLMGRADPLVRVTNCMREGNAQAISSLRLDGQNRTAGTLGLQVRNVRGLTIHDLLSEGFKGTAYGGGALDLWQIDDADVGHSTFRNGAAIFPKYATGTLGIGNATDSVFHDLVVYDDQALGVKGSGGTLTNVEFYNLRVTVGSPTVLSWPAISFEMNEIDGSDVTIRNSYFNATLSLTDAGVGSQLARGRRYNIHHNQFDIPSKAQTGVLQYALELDQNSSDVHHNFFDGGTNPISNFESAVKRGNSVHHNVFDNQENWVAVMRFRSGLFDFEFYKNTVVMRQEWFDHLFKVDELTSSTSPVIRDNIFRSAHPIGDRLGLGLDASGISRNGFYNVGARGKSPLLGDPGLPLSGGFPRAYVPTAGSPAAALGAFAQGTWSVGPVRTRCSSKTHC